MLRKCQIALALLSTVVFLAACQSATQRVFENGKRAGFNRQTAVANGFDLMVMSSNRPTTSEYLHVYLEGDGVPWAKTTVIAADPTSASVLMLDLMALDQSDSVYIGRPCYNGTAFEPECNKRLWTSARYSIKVVDAMASALTEYMSKRDYRYIRLFGHSGGGALAMLLAERFEQVTDVITIAGNLNIRAWTSHHGYTPLYSSLNPSDQPALGQGLRQWHWMGGRDVVIPPALITPFIQSQTNAFGSTLPNYSHNCCWQTIWPQVLLKIKDRRIDGMPGDVIKTPDENVVGVDGLEWSRAIGVN